MNKLILCTILLVVAAIYVKAQPGTCGGDCLLTEDCFVEAGDTTCRCSYFHCKRIEEGVCGGGCISDSQCQEWAQGDPNCVCSTLFECHDISDMQKPGYQVFAKFIQATKGTALRQKADKIMKLKGQ